MSVKVISPPSGAMVQRPTDAYTNEGLRYPNTFTGENEGWHYLWLVNPNSPPSSGLDKILLIQYKKEIKIYFEGGKLKTSTTLGASSCLMWSNYNATYNNWRQTGTTNTYLEAVLASLEITSTESLIYNMYGTGYIYTNSNYDTILTTNISNLDGLDIIFSPDDGTYADAGGGNQNWGQGSPTTNTEGGTFDNTSDVVGMGEVNSTKTGIIFNNYYVINRKQLIEIKRNMWDITVPTFTKPSEAIISVMAYPNIIPQLINTESDSVKIGNTTMKISETEDVTTIPANVLNTLTFGVLHLEPYFGGFQDYSPYTKIKIWLPFLGFRDIDPLYVQDKDLEVRYVVNYTDGSCIVLIYSDGVIIYRHNGQLGQTIPLAQVDNQLIEATTGIAMQTAAASLVNPAFGVASLAKDSLASLSSVVNNRPSISGSAGGGGETEWSLPLEVFLLIERPQCAIAQTYNHEKGRPSLVNKKLSNCKGFNSMVDPKITANCTQSENDLINNMLREGVIINV